MEIKVKKATNAELKEMGVRNWGIWEKEESIFDWYYDSTEICYFIEGDVEIKTSDGKITKMGKGDMVTFPKGLECTWCIKQKVKKYYKFE